MKSKKRTESEKNLPKLVLDVCGATDTGKVRAQNEDAFTVDMSRGIFLIADGMGGHNAGKVASEIVAQVLPVILVQHLESEKNPTSTFVKQGIQEAMNELNQLMLTQANKNPFLKDMGATAILALNRPEGVYIVHLGDSRAYLIRNREISQLTRDHSLVQRMLELGEITPEEARVHPMRHIVLSGLGRQDEIEPEISSFKPQSGDYLILCSDGLSDMIDDESIRHSALKRRKSKTICSALIQGALEAGGKDNVTVIVAKWKLMQNLTTCSENLFNK